jgi:hypothetical protein
MEYNLLSSLRKYRPRENQDPLENFPIHIRKPMIELLRGTTTAEEQVSKFMDANLMIVSKILECQRFYKMREMFARNPEV